MKSWGIPGALDCSEPIDDDVGDGVTVTGGLLIEAAVVELDEDVLFVNENASNTSPKQRHGSNPGCDDKLFVRLKWLIVLLITTAILEEF